MLRIRKRVKGMKGDRLPAQRNASSSRTDKPHKDSGFPWRVRHFALHNRHGNERIPAKKNVAMKGRTKGSPLADILMRGSY